MGRPHTPRHYGTWRTHFLRVNNGFHPELIRQRRERDKREYGEGRKKLLLESIERAEVICTCPKRISK